MSAQTIQTTQATYLHDDPSPPRPRPGWTVHSPKDGRRMGVVRRVKGYSHKDPNIQGRVVWVADDYGHTVLSTWHWEDTPIGVYRPPSALRCVRCGHEIDEGCPCLFCPTPATTEDRP